MSFNSPLRYPGGKGCLAPFVKYLIISNGLSGGIYIEPYAGGAGIACTLLLDDAIKRAIINDADFSIYAFWKSVSEYSDELCRKIHDTPITIAEWKRQRSIQNDKSASMLELGFSTLFLNRTNISGVLSGGVIGGIAQNGNYPIDARYNKDKLIEKITRLANMSDRFEIHNSDAMDFINQIRRKVGRKSLIYFDPPYYQKGSALYRNYYTEADHVEVATVIKKLKTPWMCSYDNVPEIRRNYKRMQRYVYDISYSARNHYVGREVAFFSRTLTIPAVKSPLEIKEKDCRLLLRDKSLIYPNEE